MKKLLITSVSLIALGTAIVLFEGLVANNHANFYPCSSGLICDYPFVQEEFSIGIFPVIAGAIILGFGKVLSKTQTASKYPVD